MRIPDSSMAWLKRPIIGAVGLQGVAVVLHFINAEVDIEARGFADNRAVDLLLLEHPVHFGHQLVAGGPEPINAALLENLEGGETCGCGDGVAAKGADARDECAVLLGHGVEDPHYLLAACDCGEGVPAADGFAEGGHVGGDAIVLLGAAVGPAESGDDLIENQGNLVVAGHFTEAFQETGLRGDDALAAFGDNRAQLVVVFFNDCGWLFLGR